MDLLGQNGQEGGVKMMKIVVEVVMMRMVILCVRIVLVWEREELEEVVGD